MAVITGFYVNLTRSNIDPRPRGHEALFAATSDRLPSHPTSKNERATDSYLALIGAHQYSVRGGESAHCTQ